MWQDGFAKIAVVVSRYMSTPHIAEAMPTAFLMRGRNIPMMNLVAQDLLFDFATSYLERRATLQVCEEAEQYLQPEACPREHKTGHCHGLAAGQ